MGRARSILQSMLSKPKINIGREPWYSRAAGDVADILTLVRSDREKESDNIKSNINLLPQLSMLIRDQDGLDSYEKVANQLSDRAEKHSDLAIYAPIIKGSISNIRDDYKTFTEAMDKSAEMFNDESFLDTQEEFVNLTENFKNYKDKDGKQKYTDVIGFLTAESERVGTLMGRIESAGKGRQFKYNKNANHTDQEIMNKLKSYENRISTAIQTAFGDGIINMDEAEFIMAGDVKAYNRFKKDKVRIIENQYKSINRVQEKIRSQKLSLDKKLLGDSDANMIAQIFTEQILSAGGEQMEGLEVTGTTQEQIKQQLKVLNQGLATQKQEVKDAYEYWEGRPYFHKTKTGSKKISELMDAISEDDGKDINNPILINTQNAIPEKPEKISNKEVKARWNELSNKEKAEYGSVGKYRDYLVKQQG